jgi:hypothetical protein
MAFSDTWTVLQASLSNGATIDNWTAHSGEVGEPFQIQSIGNDAIVVTTPGAVTPQWVRRKDFEAVYELWDGYVRGRIPRSTFTPLTRRSKYVISLLHWLQNQSESRLP